MNSPYIYVIGLKTTCNPKTFRTEHMKDSLSLLLIEKNKEKIGYTLPKLRNHFSFRLQDFSRNSINEGHRDNQTPPKYVLT